MPGFAADDSQEVTGQGASTPSYSRGYTDSSVAAADHSTVGPTRTFTDAGSYTSQVASLNGSGNSGYGSNRGGREDSPVSTVGDHAGYGSNRGGREDNPEYDVSHNDAYGVRREGGKGWYSAAGHAKWQQTANAAADFYGIPRPIFNALIYHESGWRVGAVSPAGAISLGQLMPDTARYLKVNPQNPVENIWGAAAYLAEQKQTAGNWHDALNAYNAGPGSLDPKDRHYYPNNPYANAVTDLYSYQSGDARALGFQVNGGMVPSRMPKGAPSPAWFFADRKEEYSGRGSPAKSTPLFPVDEKPVAAPAEVATDDSPYGKAWHFAQPFVRPWLPKWDENKKIIYFGPDRAATPPGETSPPPAEVTVAEPTPDKSSPAFDLPGWVAPLLHLAGVGGDGSTIDAPTGSGVGYSPRRKRKRLPTTIAEVQAPIMHAVATAAKSPASLLQLVSSDNNAYEIMRKGGKPSFPPAANAGSFNTYDFLKRLLGGNTDNPYLPTPGNILKSIEGDHSGAGLPSDHILPDAKQFVLDNLPLIGAGLLATLFAIVGVRSLTSPGSN